eukprot:Em0001g2942a
MQQQGPGPMDHQMHQQMPRPIDHQRFMLATPRVDIRYQPYTPRFTMLYSETPDMSECVPLDQGTQAQTFQEELIQGTSSNHLIANSILKACAL